MKMVLDNQLEHITKEFDSKRIRTTVEYKNDLGRIEKYSERLCKYSQTVSGYMHQLQLEGYVEVED